MPGTAFGERSLLGKGARKATIISKGETYFACLDKEHFDKVLSKKVISC
jgi:CRP-like cAMP-binding protein